MHSRVFQKKKLKRGRGGGRSRVKKKKGADSQDLTLWHRRTMFSFSIQTTTDRLEEKWVKCRVKYWLKGNAACCPICTAHLQQTSCGSAASKWKTMVFPFKLNELGIPFFKRRTDGCWCWVEGGESVKWGGRDRTQWPLGGSFAHQEDARRGCGCKPRPHVLPKQ